MKISIVLVLTFTLFISCRNDYEAPVPHLAWDLFEDPNAVWLNSEAIKKLEGIYTLNSENNEFGHLSVIKSSYVIENSDTLWYISFFCQSNVKYFICRAKQLNDTILINGYWRNQTNTQTGLARLMITPENGAAAILNNMPADTILIDGLYGNDETVPGNFISLGYFKSYNNSNFYVLAHRGGGRTSDLLPASENSVELIKMASLFGAAGVEIDVRMTSDKVPVLYHDENLNDRLTQKSGLVGAIKNYSYSQLSAFVRLKNGERIPTLREALNAIIYNTPLEIVWLDIKYDGSLQPIKELQEEFHAKAVSVNRNVKIYIGIPSTDVKNQFLLLGNFQSVPSLVELSADDARTLDADVWAPRWTEGLQQNLVLQMQSENRLVFTWTIDVAGYAQQYINTGNFNGILSNYPTLIAFYHYVQ